MLISIVIPCYKSRDTIKLVVDGVIEEFTKRPEYDYRFILVCDGSPDDTFSQIRPLTENKKIIGINLAKNFGQQSARMAAIPYLEGDIAVFMDDDGQHIPEGVFRLIDTINEGYDIVYADFNDKQHSFLQKAGSWFNGKMTEIIFKKPKGVKISSFSAIRTFVAKEFMNYKNREPYFSGYLMQITHNIGMVKMEHAKRISGESNYSLPKLINLWFRGFIGFSVVPLRAASFLGIICALLGFAFGFYVTMRKVLNPAIPVGYTSMIALLMFIGGIIMMMLGMLGEYVGRIYMHLNHLPQYVIKEIINAPKKL